MSTYANYLASRARRELTEARNTVANIDGVEAAKRRFFDLAEDLFASKQWGGAATHYNNFLRALGAL